MKVFTVTETGNVIKGVFVRKSSYMTLFGIPLGQGIHKDMEGDDDGAPSFLHSLDIVERTEPDGYVLPVRVVSEANRRDRRALIVIDLPAGEGGETTLTSNEARSRWDENAQRVVRDVLPIEEAVGVSVFAEANSDNGKRFLVGMMPGASLRINRTGKLHGEPPIMTLVWDARHNPSAVHKGAQTEEEFIAARANVKKNWNGIRLFWPGKKKKG